MAAAAKWLKDEKGKRTVLIVLTGANLAEDKHRAIWQRDFLSQPPHL